MENVSELAMLVTEVSKIQVFRENMYKKVVIVLFFLMSLPVMAENRQVNPWAYRNDTMQGQAQGRRPWGEMPSATPQGSSQSDTYRQGYYYSPYYYPYRPYGYSPYTRPGYEYQGYPYGGREYQTYGFPMYPGGYLPGMSGLTFPGLGW